MANIRSFAAPHKGLRHALSRLSFLLGSADFSDPAQLLGLQQMGAEVFALLKNHAHTENTHTLAHLEARVPGAGDHDRHDHEELEKEQAALERELAGFTGSASADAQHGYYLRFSAFHGRYLEHIHEEETVTELLLQQHFTDEELAGHRAAIMQTLPFPTLLCWLRYIIPAQRDAESLGMLRGLQASAPPAAFAEVLQVLAAEMDGCRLERLYTLLDAPNVSG